MVKKDLGLINAVNFCVYPAQIEDKFISIPQDELENGSLELSVRYLVSNYGFKIQSCIPGSVLRKEEFKPNFKEKIEIIKLGLFLVKTASNIRYEIVEVDNEDITIKDCLNYRKKIIDKNKLIKYIKNNSYYIERNRSFIA